MQPGESRDDLPTISADGVDLTLIRWYLSLTPGERLDALQRYVDQIMSLRDAAIDTGLPRDPTLPRDAPR